MVAMPATITSKRAVFQTTADHSEYHWPYYRNPDTEYTTAYNITIYYNSK